MTCNEACSATAPRRTALHALVARKAPAHYSPQGEGEELRSSRRKLLPTVIGYVTAIVVGLALPAAAVALYFGIAVYLVVPFRDVARLLFRRS